jgi:hypothetical protein
MFIFLSLTKLVCCVVLYACRFADCLISPSDTPYKTNCQLSPSWSQSSRGDQSRRPRLHRPATSSVIYWYHRLHGWMATPPLSGVNIFTDQPPRPPPTSVSAYTVGWSHHRCWASTSSPTGRLIRRRQVFPPTRLVDHTTVVGPLCLH